MSAAVVDLMGPSGLQTSVNRITKASARKSLVKGERFVRSALTSSSAHTARNKTNVRDFLAKFVKGSYVFARRIRNPYIPIFLQKKGGG